nr:MAG TPA: hypothetical protein [Caudoviricetes sp.]
MLKSQAESLLFNNLFLFPYKVLMPFLLEKFMSQCYTPIVEKEIYQPTVALLLIGTKYFVYLVFSM